MPTKTKTAKTAANKLLTAAQQAGLIVMTAAVTFGMVELPDHPNSRIVLPSQPVFAFANDREDVNNNNVLRRENEETEQHYISYSVAQRTPARSGRR